MTDFITRWLKDESGAVTADWVVLTAAIIGLALLAILTVTGSIKNISGKIEQAVASTEVK